MSTAGRYSSVPFSQELGKGVSMARSPKRQHKGSAPRGLWQTESLRLTVFPVPESGHSAQNWWTELFDAPPDQVVTKPRSGQIEIQGVLDEGLFQLQADPMRVTLLHTAKPPEEPIMGNHVLGPYSAASGEFAELVVKGISLGSFPRIQRLAFGAVLCQPVTDLQTGHGVLARYLPNVRIDEGTSDFLYQINRKRPSSVINGLGVNRLSKWSMALVHGVILRGDGAVVHTARELSCRAELDINSDAENKNEIPQESMGDLFSECVEFAGEIATNGDVP